MGLQPGKRFGRYELVSRLGYGGMAETWLARLLGEAGFSKPTVLKKVLPEYSDDYAFTSMLISEARIAATVSHDNIAQVFDFGQVDGEYFLAMEYVDGQPLHHLVHQALHSGWTALPVPVAAFIGMKVCRGLHYAHTRKDESGKPLGIVHRDISPENVLISYEGQVKIVDFGLAKARELSVQATEPGVVKGKYLFFSPEQARGQEVDARTDVWATGITLYEMCCGKLPVEGPEFVVLPKMSRGEFPRPRALNPRVPRQLEDILMTALAVRREERFESSRAFGDALAGFLYSAAPRFSSVTLSYFIQDLFRDAMTRQGRDIQVPRSFQDELAAWREVPRAPPSAEDAESLVAPEPEPSEPEPPPEPEPPSEPEASEPERSEPERSEPEALSEPTGPTGPMASSRSPEFAEPTVEMRPRGLAAESPRAKGPPAPSVAPQPSRTLWMWGIGGGTAVGWVALGLLFLLTRAPSPTEPVSTTPQETPPSAQKDPMLRGTKPAGQSEEYERFMQQAKQAIGSRRYQAAVDNYRAALKVNPGSLDAKEGLGFSLVLGNTGEESNEQAVVLLQEVVTGDILNARAWFSLGMALQELQREDEAVEAYRKYLLLEPTGRFATDARRALKQLGAD
ncbi:serine/threonine-protein kinase [Hyalangium gracile]|uniref:serine/threonine-protein kinase n=1 Tax=Hyalangium gracile TaxID=394092 RepID=UPI001CCB3D7B|nr:serine/threonine-protein kinase [Hyalangium gracile]